MTTTQADAERPVQLFLDRETFAGIFLKAPNLFGRRQNHLSRNTSHVISIL